MTLELSTEEIVTKLLSSNQILKKQENKFFNSGTTTLGEFLKTNIEINPEPIDYNQPISKYSFIKNKWII